MVEIVILCTKQKTIQVNRNSMPLKGSIHTYTLHFIYYKKALEANIPSIQKQQQQQQ